MTDHMTLSELISELQEIEEEHGDIGVKIDGPPGDYAYVDTKRYFGDTYAVVGLTHEKQGD